MFCTKCGKENAQGAAFCIVCGNALGTNAANKTYAMPTSAVISKPLKKGNAAAIALGVLSVLLAAALVLSLTGVIAISGSSVVSSKSFSTPEDAIEYFVECMGKGDFEGALSACAVNEMAEGFDYEAQAERLRTLLPAVTSYMPSEYEQYAALNRYKLAGQVLMQMTSFSVSFDLPDEYKGLIEGTPVMLEKDKLPKGLIERLDPALPEGLEIVDIVKHRLHDSQANRENQKKQAKVYGADDVQFRAVLYEYKGDFYIGGFTLVEYGGKWLIHNMSDPLAGISAYGVPIKVSDESEFYDMEE